MTLSTDKRAAIELVAISFLSLFLELAVLILRRKHKGSGRDFQRIARKPLRWGLDLPEVRSNGRQEDS
jgi:hypothetical protein